MSVRTLPVCLLLAACNQPLGVVEGRDALKGRIAEGDLVITELHLERGGDCPTINGQWIELTNTGDNDVSLASLDVMDAAGNRAPLTETDEVLWPGKTVTVGGGDWDGYCRDGQFAPVAFWGNDLKLDAGGAAIVSRDTDSIVDQTPEFSADRVVAGTTLSLRPELTDAESNDDPKAWYGADDCESTNGMSPAHANAPCLEDLGWFDADCDGSSCTVGSDFDPVEWLETAYWIAHGELERNTEAQVEREGLYLRYVRFDQDATLPGSYDPSAASWVFVFSSRDYNPFGPKDFVARIQVTDGTVELDDDFGDSSGSATSLDDALGAIQVGPGPIMDDLSSSWTWSWTSFDHGVLTWASYDDEPQWSFVAEGTWSETRLEYSATTGERIY